VTRRKTRNLTTRTQRFFSPKLVVVRVVSGLKIRLGIIPILKSVIIICTSNDAINEVKDWFKNSQHQIKYVDTVYLIWDGLITIIKK